MSNSRSRKAVVCGAALLSMVMGLRTEPVWAQSSTGTLSGLVVDQTDAVVPGTQVTLENPATSARREAVTSSEGSFVFPALQPGLYKLTAVLPGFAPLELERIGINVNDQR